MATKKIGEIEVDEDKLKRVIDMIDASSGGIRSGNLSSGSGNAIPTYAQIQDLMVKLDTVIRQLGSMKIGGTGRNTP
jgi:hypothetical protein